MGLDPEIVRLVQQVSLLRFLGCTADELYISPKTVGHHVENIYTKIGVSTRAGAAVYAMEQRLLGRTEETAQPPP